MVAVVAIGRCCGDISLIVVMIAVWATIRMLIVLLLYIYPIHLAAKLLNLVICLNLVLLCHDSCIVVILPSLGLNF